jgi:hypothetical protein
MVGSVTGAFGAECMMLKARSEKNVTAEERREYV